MAKGTTRLSDDVTKPQPTQAGDAPADTTDATEEATSVRPDKGAAAKAGHQTVNAVRPAKTKRVKKAVNPGSRTETYTAHKPDGTEVQVTHDLETGQTTVTPG